MKGLNLIIGLCVLFITGTASADLNLKDSGCKWELKYNSQRIEDSVLCAEICFWTVWNEDSSSVAGTVADAFQAGGFDEQDQIQINVPDIKDVCIQDEVEMYEPAFSIIADQHENSWDVNSNSAYADGAWQDLLDRWTRL